MIQLVGKSQLGRLGRMYGARRTLRAKARGKAISSGGYAAGAPFKGRRAGYRCWQG